ncbi:MULTISPECIES: class I SAM-dependent DNA methyltransferase [unclassified Nocardioides]|uniref:HsdM family class I SAM-dependent methyltransferase n=1 Tax=unclassified Nocardioides TaxID=2615069 RepID=UPI0011511ED6|nr:MULTISPECIES: N-6 DNA methylase [unclassified Nocardioides]TQK71533.1 N-6 DNA methylase [Nocardioides sp. SLBN-35]WGY04279.1 N-6 DNA methylase [Nocardioides sp. QY071]
MAGASDAYERHLAEHEPDRRRAQGSFYTPPDLVAWILDRTLPGAASVLDPACGTGHFLVAAAERLGVRAVHGSDLDPEAVRIARERLQALAPDVPAAEIAERVVVADGLTAWEGRRFDAVVGNPPFLGQLRRHSAGRSETHRRALGAYTDTSAVFLHRALDLAGPGGVVALVQPLSVLATRDAGPVRAAVAEHGAVTDFWCGDRPVFDGTTVLTCVPVVRIGATPPTEPDGWGALAAPGFGIPAVALTGSGVLGDLATCTADFRDQYYGLAPFVHDRLPGGTPLVTTGLIDPAESRWGRAPTRFARRRYDAPAVDLAALRADGALARWAEARLVPKLLVAGQGRVIEAVADEAGAWLPSVPVVSVVPHDRSDLWRLLAVLLAPPVVAHAAARYLGTGLTPGSVKVSARQLAALPLPTDAAAWAEGAALARRAQAADAGERPHLLAATGRVMTTAYGGDAEVHAWWAARVRRTDDSGATSGSTPV